VREEAQDQPSKPNSLHAVRVLFPPGTSAEEIERRIREVLKGQSNPLPHA